MVRFHVAAINPYCRRTRKFQSTCHCFIHHRDLLNRGLNCGGPQHIFKAVNRRLVIRAARDIKDFNYYEVLFPSIFVTENRTVLRPVTSPSSQLPITLLEIEDQFAFQVLQIVDFAPNFGDFAAQQVLDFPRKHVHHGLADQEVA